MNRDGLDTIVHLDKQSGNLTTSIAELSAHDNKVIQRMDHTCMIDLLRTRTGGNLCMVIRLMDR